MQFSIKFPLVLVAAAAVVLSCSRESAYGDAGKNEDLPGVVGMCYDDGSSTSTALAVYWDPRPAMRRGATSFTIQLVRRLGESAGNVYDAEFSRTFATSDSANSKYCQHGLPLSVNTKGRGERHATRSYLESFYADRRSAVLSALLFCAATDVGVL